MYMPATFLVSNYSLGYMLKLTRNLKWITACVYNEKFLNLRIVCVKNTRSLLSVSSGDASGLNNLESCLPN